MAFNFRAVDRDQQFLMPPSMAEWLPEDHLAWFVVDVVDGFHLAGFDESYRLDGRGAAAYAPSMMVAVWLYAYCIGERSSRRIERRPSRGRGVLGGRRPTNSPTMRRSPGSVLTRCNRDRVVVRNSPRGVCRRVAVTGLVAIDGTGMGRECIEKGKANRSASRS